ncbi:MAG TPA: hypothetical protein VH309_14660 [Elusimicrobiota bacterium]|jgi:hypothetical protein|nr:hypothetical protein [Elusimicrobiota bacterium]
MPEGALRRALGRVCVFFGLGHLLPVAFVWLSSGGPAPVMIAARSWSLFFYVHFIALVVVGLGFQAFCAARAKVFYGGPLIDFLIAVASFMMLETFTALVLRRGAGPSWPALLPGLLLVAFGARLGTGRPLLGS